MRFLMTAKSVLLRSQGLRPGRVSPFGPLATPLTLSANICSKIENLRFCSSAVLAGIILILFLNLEQN